MSRTSPDANHIGRQVDALTTQVRRIADALTTPVVHADATADDAPTTTPDARSWITRGTRDLSIPEQAPAADEDALRSARRDNLLVLLSRASRGVLTPDEGALMRPLVEAEMRDADTARAVAAGNLRHVRTIVPEMEAQQAAIERVREVTTGWQRMTQDRHVYIHEAARVVVAALDGTEQPTTETE